jgi:hypothetical protein
MTQLPMVIHKAGFELVLIRRAGSVALYRQHFPRGNADNDAYEVILPQCRNTNRNGHLVEPYEGYSAAEFWGKKAWTFTGLAQTFQKLKQFAQKASCRGTVGRKNRFAGQTGTRTRLMANGPKVRASNRPFRTGRWTSSHTLGQRKAREVKRQSYAELGLAQPPGPVQLIGVDGCYTSAAF